MNRTIFLRCSALRMGAGLASEGDISALVSEEDDMRTLAALVLESELPITVGGLTLTERAVLLAHRAGLGPVRVWGARALNPASDSRLRPRGISVVQLPRGSAPLEGVSAD